MGIVVAPYNPWKQQLAVHLLSTFGPQILSNQRASEAGKKLGVLMGRHPITGEEDNSQTNYAAAEAERQRSAADYELMKTGIELQRLQDPSLSGQSMVAGLQQTLSGATPPPAATPPLMAPGGSVLPPPASVEESILNGMRMQEGAVNPHTYTPSSSWRIPLSLTPEGFAGKAARTPTPNVFGMMNDLSDPRFSPYANELLDMFAKVNNIYSTRRGDNFKDHDAMVQAIANSTQANLGTSMAATPSEMLAALGSFQSNPAEVAVSSEKNISTERSARDAAEKDLQGKMYGADQNLTGSLAHSQAMRDSANIHAGATRDSAKTYADARNDQPGRSAGQTTNDAMYNARNVANQVMRESGEIDPAKLQEIYTEAYNNFMKSQGFAQGNDGAWQQTAVPEQAGANPNFIDAKSISQILTSGKGTPKQMEERAAFVQKVKSFASPLDAIDLLMKTDFGGRRLDFSQARALYGMLYPLDQRGGGGGGRGF